MKFCLKLILLLFFLPAMVFGQQKGFLRGKITDQHTGEELIGATVAVVGEAMGTITDFDGNYSIQLAEGNWTITVSYISYQSQTFEKVVITAGQVNIKDVQLSSATTELEEVKVVATFRKRTEAAMQVMQRKSASLLDGISAQQMSGLGDSNAASALKRVTGVSVEGGKYVFVRGLGDRYTKTTLNGADIPSLDPNKNTVQMDLFPSNLIENMVVFKTFAPNLPGDFSGGYVDIVTRDFPERPTFAFSATLGFNPQVTFNPEYLTYQTGSLDWLGFDDGTRDMPELAKGDIPVYVGIDNPALDAVTHSFNTHMQPIRGRAGLNQGYAVSYGNQFQTGSESSIGVIASITYKNEYKYYDDGETGVYMLPGSNSASLTTQQQLDDTRGSNEVLWGAMTSATYKFNPSHKIGLTLLHNQSGESSARYKEGAKPSDDYQLKIQERTLQYLQRGFTNGQIKGEHIINSLNQLKIDWLGSYTHTTQDEPDLRFFNNDYRVQPSGDTIFAISPNLYTVPTRYYRTLFENNASAKADLTLPFTFLGDQGKLSAGGSYTWKERSSSERNFDIRDQNQSYHGNVVDYFNTANIGSDAPGTYGVYVNSSKNTEGINSYFGRQKVFNAYAMVDVLIWQNLRAVTGLRFETTDIFVENLVDKSHSKYDRADISNRDLLPSLNLIYSIKDNMNLRGAASRTLARPVFRELAPYAFYDFLSGRRKIGNPDLKRALIDNYDLRYEYFFAPGEMVSVSGFYKRFLNPIEQVDNPQAVNAEITFQNADRAQLFGIEVEFRKSLDFIGPLKNFEFILNTALIRSMVSIDSLELLSIHATDPEHPDYRVMFGQAPYIINGALMYKNENKGWSGNLSFNITGPKLFLVIKGGTPDVFEQPFASLNLNISKKFGKHSIKFSADNILDTETRYTYTYHEVSYNFERYGLGRIFSLGYSYLFD